MKRSFRQFIQSRGKEAVFTFGKFNPPGAVHEKILRKMASISEANNYFIFLSKKVDEATDPLEYGSKVRQLRKVYPSHGRSVINDTSIGSVLESAAHIHQKGYSNITMVTSSERVVEYQTILDKNNGKMGRHGYYVFENISVIPCDNFLTEKNIKEASASMLEHIENSDLGEFSRCLPKDCPMDVVSELFHELRFAMGFEEKSSGLHISLEPVSEERERYVAGDLYCLGDIVESVKTEDKYKIAWLGSNYLVVENDLGDKKRMWLTDVRLIEKASDMGFRKMSDQNPIKKAKERIRKEKESDRIRHDQMLDKARLRRTRKKNQGIK